MSKDHSDRVWKIFGREDPYFGVYSREEFRSGNLDDGAMEDFFDSGKEHVELVFEVIHEYLDSGFKPRRALDFGCGVGRVTIPLARHCRQAVGVDISEHMLMEARKNSRLQGVDNVQFLGSDDSLSQVEGGFDLLHSFIVFQHLPVDRGMSVIREMLTRLESGGIGVLHITFHRKASSIRKLVNHIRKKVEIVNGVVNLVQGKPFSYPMMQMNTYDLNNIFLALHSHDCANVVARFTRHGGYSGTILFFRKGVVKPWVMEDAESRSS